MEQPSKSPLAAYVVPFVIFLGGLALVEVVRSLGGTSENLLLSRPEFWVYPLQTLLCGAALVFYWRRYDFGNAGGFLAAAAAGLLALALWLSPRLVFGAAPRTAGFDPTVFFETPAIYWLTVAARFARLVVVVPLVEEIFWRGFLMRYLIREDFENVALGTFRPLSFFGVAGIFMLVHGMADWPAAFLTGLIFNGLLVKTKSLAACVAAHAITNLGLGLYIMATRQWGFW
ncbi:MAG: CAAX prenyl protease-related protein [Verrucomicrobiae bacterium]